MIELAAVVVDHVTAATNKLFTYSVPPELRGSVRCGTQVKVPFNRRWLTGYVTPEPAPEAPGIKPIAEIIAQDLFTVRTWALARWISEYYLCHLVEAVRLIIPPGASGRFRVPRLPQVVELNCAREVASSLSSELEPRAPAQARLLQVAAAAAQGLTKTELLRRAQAGSSSLDALLKRGVLTLRELPLGTASCTLLPTGVAPELNRDQAQAVEQITAALEAEQTETFLLHGVTGSGKTEVYLQALAASARSGRGGIVLVPEIALTPQTVRRFQSRFGSQVAVLHSALAVRERYAEWQRIQRGEARVVVGARSAVFAPVNKLGLIILDEEHEPAYKQDESPRYAARDVALKRAAEENAVVVLGSATPSVTSYYRAQSGNYRLLTLPERVASQSLPQVTVVDMRAELAAGNRSIFSRDLLESLRVALLRGEQAILFLNRRGYSTFILCRHCGQVATCPHCEIALTWHKGGRRLVCHHCGYSERPYQVCPRCGSNLVREFGCGTERVEAEATRLLPGARVLRLDADTTAERGAHDKILTAFGRREANILVGTQMVAKGLDFARVSVVGIISADLSLHLPDPYAWERTFQLLEQVAGRAGRGKAAGRVILQTYNPEHPSIVCAGRHDYEGFYRIELERRRRRRYPPFVEVVLLRAIGPAEGVLQRVLGFVVERIGKRVGQGIEGPAPSPFLKQGDNYRWQVVFKGDNLASLKEDLGVLLTELKPECKRQRVRLSVDVDPLSYL
ncbi:MAG: primosomal protein N' [Firmicutes bacterium]|jgi:primosomal protein N' (replication factor Y)|nr:primosomal protein N' [Bacillota bacterium]